MKLLTLKNENNKTGLVDSSVFFDARNKVKGDVFNMVSSLTSQLEFKKFKTLIFETLNKYELSFESKLNSKFKNITTTLEDNTKKIINLKEWVIKELSDVKKYFKKIVLENNKVIYNIVDKKINSIFTQLEKQITHNSVKIRENNKVKQTNSININSKLYNISYPEIIEKSIIPGAIRYDKNKDVIRICTKTGWRDL